jgi:ribosome biogenesis protein MAK21
LFFHKYFSKKLARDEQIKAAAAKRKKKGGDGEDSDEDVSMADMDEPEEDEEHEVPVSKSMADAGAADEDEESDPEEDEIWKVSSWCRYTALPPFLSNVDDLLLIQAMQASMPQAGYDDNDLLEDSDEDEDLDISDDQEEDDEDAESLDEGEDDGRMDDAGKFDIYRIWLPSTNARQLLQNSTMRMRTTCQWMRTMMISST